MKNLTKILFIVAAMVAFSCTTDVTEDLGVAVNGQTEISLSLEESRTHISGKAGDEYPLYWSAGDKIAVNGVTSEPLSESDHGKANATFTLNGVVAYPYNIVYPAPAEGVTAAEGLQVVSFLATQEYTAGTFAEGAVPMYAQVANESEAASLKHLAGVLRIAPKGEGVVLTSMTVTAESGKIAGNFDLDCATGTLTAHDDALNTVTVTFGEGLTLGAEATPIYVAVPAGEYNIFAVTLNTATDSMLVRFDTEGEKAVKAGIVREFNEFVYAPNAAASGIFEIYDEASLRRFAASAAKFYPYTSAKVVAAIDMTGKEWTPIEGFAHAFDGGNFEIKGLNAPLFGETAATEIKNVKLVDVAIVANNKTNFGVLAEKITATDAVVENCYISGTLTVNLDTDSTHIAGFFNTSASTKKFSNLTSELYIKITGKITNQLYADGIMFSHSGALEDIKHLGTIEYAGSQCEDLRIGGIVQTCKNLTNCQNGSPTDNSKGHLIVNGVCGPIRIGGIVALATNGQTMTKCVNYGKVYTTENTTSKQIFMGGISGLSQNASPIFDSCENNGELAIEQSHVKASGPRVGGFIGQIMTSGTVTVKNGFINRGAINIDPRECEDNIQIAGFVANYSTDITTESTGVIKNEGHITYSGKATSGTTRVAGIVAASAKVFPNGSLKFVNTGDITVTGTAPTLAVGGIYGNSSKKLEDARCFCNIKATTADNVGMIASGDYSKSYPILNSHCGGTIQKKGTEVITLNESNYYNYIQNSKVTSTIALENRCGYISSIDAIPMVIPITISDADSLLAFAESAATTTADISITADIDMTGQAWTPIEGYVGNVHGNGNKIKGLTAPLFGTISGSILDLHLTDVNIEVTDIKAEYGALAGKIDSSDAVVRNCSASGKMKINLAMSEAITGNGSNKDIDIAGLVGYTTSTREFSNLTNDVDIEIAGTFKNNIVAAGLITVGASCSLSNSQNLGKITYTATSNSHVFMGGLVHECKSVTDCVNGSAEDTTFSKGALTIDGTTKNAYASGFSPSGRSNITLTRCHNYGAITYTENAVTGGTTLPAGAVGYYSPSSAVLILDACANHAPISVNNSTIGGDLKVGGIIGHYGGSNLLTIRNGYTNTGDFNISPKSVAAGKSVQVGGMVGNFSATWTTDSTGGVYNSGNITYSGASSSTSTVRVSGITAAMAKDIPAIEGFEIINTGDIKSTGTGKAVYVGGILGAGKLVDGAKCHCNIRTENVTAYGWIMPAERTSTLKATNCQIGGNTVEIDEADENEKLSPITADNFFDYIYSTPIDKATAEADGCSLLSTKPTIR